VIQVGLVEIVGANHQSDLGPRLRKRPLADEIERTARAHLTIETAVGTLGHLHALDKGEIEAAVGAKEEVVEAIALRARLGVSPQGEGISFLRAGVVHRRHAAHEVEHLLRRARPFVSAISCSLIVISDEGSSVTGTAIREALVLEVVA
jgi:hypothetical protein